MKRRRRGGGHVQTMLHGCFSMGLLAAAAGCPAGQYYKSTGLPGTHRCTACNAGQYSRGADSPADPTSCTDCVAGRFAASSGSDVCISCQAGLFVGSTRATACTYCEPGKYGSRSGASSCDDCPANSLSAQGSTAVAACHCNGGFIGTITSVASICTACNVGRFRAETAPADRCTECELGQYQDKAGQPSCISCGALDGCRCLGVSNRWPSGPGGICRQGSACQRTATCLEGATCMAAGAAHTCVCNSEDVFGLQCERTCAAKPDLDDPDQAWCGNLGSCVYDPDSTAVTKGYRCECKQGYSGPNCLKIDPCIVHAPCRNGGKCDNVTLASQGYECHCPTGFAGMNCTVLVSTWDTNSDRSLLLVVGALASALYFGIYWFLLQAFDGGNVHTRAVISVIVLVGTCLGFAIAAVLSQPCGSVVLEPLAIDPLSFASDSHQSWILGDSGQSCTDACSGARMRCDEHDLQIQNEGSFMSHIDASFPNKCKCYVRNSMSGLSAERDAFAPYYGGSGGNNRCSPGPAAEGCTMPSSETTKPTCSAAPDRSNYPTVRRFCSCVSPTTAPESEHAQSVQSKSSSLTAAVGEFETCREYVSSHAVRTNGFAIYGAAAAATILQSVLAYLFHKGFESCCFSTFATEGASRLLRGAGLALTSLLIASPGIVAGVLMNPNRLDPSRVDTVADVLVIYGWHPITFGVLVSSLPVGVVLSRVYCKERLRYRGNCVQFLADCGVPRPELFLHVEHSLASFSGVLFPFFWNAHLVNEQQEFLSFASAQQAIISREVRYARANREFASVDGVRSLSPVVCSLNILAAGWGCYMISALPAPVVWSPSLYFGAVCCIVAALLMVATSAMLIMSLSENRHNAADRNKEIIFGWGQHCKHGCLVQQCDEGQGYCRESVIPTWTMPTKCERLQEFYYCTRTYVASWTGQTAISGLNHLAALGFFTYGLYEFSDHLTLELKKFLGSGLVLTSIGVVTSAASFFQRRWAEYGVKVFPTDDSFRLACVLKALLVMNKALIVYQLSKIDMRMLPRLHAWTLWVTAVCVISVFILGLLTYAFDACRIYARPELLKDAGIPDGKKFIKMYALSFVCCKLATVFFVVLGHIPELAGCGEEVHSFKGTREMLLNRDGSATIECGVCLSNNRNHEAHCNDNATSTYYSCSTTCAKLFFSGGRGIPISLDVFVLVPVLWLPFMVYSNNEVARVIDGVWERRKNAMPMSDNGRRDLHESARVGLSTTGHGYSSIANLAHAVFMLCGVVHIYFLVSIYAETKHLGYSVDVPPGLLLNDDGTLRSQDLGSVLQGPLDAAGRYVTWSVIALNLLTMCRCLYEKLPWCSSGERETTGHSVQQMGQPLLGSQVADPINRRRFSEHSLCMFGCGCFPAPGRRPNGEPYDTCCRACAIAKGVLSPAQHDDACKARQREHRTQPSGSE